MVSLVKQELLIWRKALAGTQGFIRGHKVCHLLLGIHHFTNYLKNEHNFPGKDCWGRVSDGSLKPIIAHLIHPKDPRNT